MTKGEVITLGGVSSLVTLALKMGHLPFARSLCHSLPLFSLKTLWLETKDLKRAAHKSRGMAKSSFIAIKGWHNRTSKSDHQHWKTHVKSSANTDQITTDGSYSLRDMQPLMNA